MQALQLSAFGRPEDVVKLVELAEPSAPGTGEVLVAVEASPIHPADLLIMTGYYGYRPSLPTLLGGEGVATVLAVGGGVKEVAVGDRVLLPPLHQYPNGCCAFCKQGASSRRLRQRIHFRAFERHLPTPPNHNTRGEFSFKQDESISSYEMPRNALIVST